MIARPQADEFVPFYAGYVQRIPENSDIIALMSSQPDALQGLLKRVTEAQANARPAPQEWSIKEVLGHICDAERVFAYRAMRIARADATPLPGFEQNSYIRATDFNTRSLQDLIDEFTFQRRANVLCFKALTVEETSRTGTTSDNAVSVRAILYIIVGHVMHHIESLKNDYKVTG